MGIRTHEKDGGISRRLAYRGTMNVISEEIRGRGRFLTACHIRSNYHFSAKNRDVLIPFFESIALSTKKIQKNP